MSSIDFLISELGKAVVDLDINKLAIVRYKSDKKPHTGWGVFLLGNTGAGKSTIKDGRFLLGGMGEKYYFESFDPDEIKKKIPGYDPNNPGAVHLQSKKMLEVIIDKFFENQKSDEKGRPLPHTKLHNIDNPKHLTPNTSSELLSFIYDGRGSNKSEITSLIKKATDMGYHTAIIYVNVPWEVSVLRNRIRGYEGERFAPEDLADIKGSFGKIEENFITYAEMVDKAEVLYNSDEKTKVIALECLKKYPYPQKSLPDMSVFKKEIASIHRLTEEELRKKLYIKGMEIIRRGDK